MALTKVWKRKWYTQSHTSVGVVNNDDHVDNPEATDAQPAVAKITIVRTILHIAQSIDTPATPLRVRLYLVRDDVTPALSVPDENDPAYWYNVMISSGVTTVYDIATKRTIRPGYKMGVQSYEETNNYTLNCNILLQTLLRIS